VGAVVTSEALWTKPGESFKTGSQDKRDRMSRYVEWMLTPPESREPKTKTALAEELGVTPQTLHNYGKDAFVQRELGERSRAVARVDKLPAVIEALYAVASDPDNSRSVPAAKTLLEWMNKTEAVREAPLDVQDLSEQDLVTMALEMLARAQTKGE
jgi:hypothetical protein